jgi:hypothetical protein
MRIAWRLSAIVGTAVLALVLSGCDLLGYGTPAITLYQGSTEVKPGDTFPVEGIAGSLTTPSIPIEFTIVNTGHGDLDLGGSSAVTISGTDAADFALHSAPPAAIIPGSTGNFSIEITPPWYSPVSATVTVTDASGASITFTLTGQRMAS